MIPGIVASSPPMQPDGPTDWQLIDSGVFPGGAATNWQMLAGNTTDTVLISGITAKFFRSRDSGGTWTAIALPTGESAYVRNCSWVSGTRWIAIGNSSNTTYYVSTNDGDSWISKTFAFTPSGSTIFYVDETNRSRIYARNGASLYLSTDGGETFSGTALVTFTNNLAGLVQNGSGTLMALVNINPASQYALSTNGGASWGSQTALSASYVYASGVWNGTYWILGAANAAAPVLYSATAGSGTWATAVANVNAWTMQYNPVDGSTVAAGSGSTTPISTRQSITTWVSSPVPGTSAGLYTTAAAAGNYWLAAGGAYLIRAPRAR